MGHQKFEDEGEYYFGTNVDTTFFGLNESFKVIRKQLGEERYAALTMLSDRMRAHFEADPENKTDDTFAGRALILEIEEILKSVRRRSKAIPAAAAEGPGGNSLGLAKSPKE